MSISLCVLIDTDWKTTNEWLVWPIENPSSWCATGNLSKPVTQQVSTERDCIMKLYECLYNCMCTVFLLGECVCASGNVLN